MFRDTTTNQGEKMKTLLIALAVIASQITFAADEKVIVETLFKCHAQKTVVGIEITDDQDTLYAVEHKVRPELDGEWRDSLRAKEKLVETECSEDIKGESFYTCRESSAGNIKLYTGSWGRGNISMKARLIIDGVSEEMVCPRPNSGSFELIYYK